MGSVFELMRVSFICVREQKSNDRLLYSGASSRPRSNDQPALHGRVAAAAVFGAGDVERAGAVRDELHGDRLAGARNQGFHPKGLDPDAVRAIRGADTKPDAVALDNRDGCRVERET